MSYNNKRKKNSNAKVSNDQSRCADTNSKTKHVWRRVGGGGGQEAAAKRNNNIPKPNGTAPLNRRNPEKEFVEKVGGMSWERYEEAKEYKNYACNAGVLKWDDEAGKEAFFVAKKRWFGCGGDVPPLNPDLYIDNVDWESKDQVEDDQNESFLSSITDREKEIADADANANARRYCYRIEVVDGKKFWIPECWDEPFDQIKPTGWEGDDDYPVAKTITGMIVGE